MFGSVARSCSQDLEESPLPPPAAGHDRDAAIGIAHRPLQRSGTITARPAPARRRRCGRCGHQLPRARQRFTVLRSMPNSRAIRFTPSPLLPGMIASNGLLHEDLLS